MRKYLFKPFPRNHIELVQIRIIALSISQLPIDFIYKKPLLHAEK